MNVKEKLQALLTASNNTTGESDTTLTDAVQRLVDGYGGGGVELYSSDVTGIVYTENFVMPDRLTVNTTQVRSAYENCINMKTLVIGKNYNFGGNAFKGCTSLEIVKSSSNTASEEFWNCTELKAFTATPDLSSIATWTFDNCLKLMVFIALGDRVITLENTNAFSGTGIKNSGGNGRIYVPAAMLDAYKAATNWSNFASNILAIEDNLGVVGDYL